MKNNFKLCLAIFISSLPLLTYGQDKDLLGKIASNTEKTYQSVQNNGKTINTTLGSMSKDYFIPITAYLKSIDKCVNALLDWVTHLPSVQTDISRYLIVDQVEQETQKNIKQSSEKLFNLVRYGVKQSDAEIGDAASSTSDPTQFVLRAAQERLERYSDDKTTYYSSYSPESLYAQDMLTPDSAREKAATAFIENSSANVALPPPPPLQDKNSTPSKDYLDYTVYQKTMAAVQGTITSNLARAYAERLPVQIVKEKKVVAETSKTKLINDINTADPSDPTYWTGKKDDGSDGLLKQGIVPRVMIFLNNFFSINYSLRNIYSQLERMNIQLSLLLEQNLFIAKGAYGDRIYQKIRGTAAKYQPPKDVDDKKYDKYKKDDFEK